MVCILKTTNIFFERLNSTKTKITKASLIMKLARHLLNPSAKIDDQISFEDYENAKCLAMISEKTDDCFCSRIPLTSETIGDTFPDVKFPDCFSKEMMAKLKFLMSRMLSRRKEFVENKLFWPCNDARGWAYGTTGKPIPGPDAHSILTSLCRWQ